MKKFSYPIPERKIGEVFTYNGKTYKVMDASKQPLYRVTSAEGKPLGKFDIGCCIRKPDTGNIENLCVFTDRCGKINKRHIGYCMAPYRKDGNTVYFVEVNK